MSLRITVDPEHARDQRVPGEPVASEGPWRSFLRALLRERLVIAGGAIVGVIVLLALLAPLFAALTGHGPTDQFRDVAVDGFGIPIGPDGSFWFGADGSGRDVFIRTLFGAQVSLAVGIPATTVAMLVGTTLGLLAGFFGGRVDSTISLIIDITLSFPFLVTALCLVILNRGENGQPIVSPVAVVITVIALFSWTFFARIVRGQVIELRSRPFIEAALAVGASRGRIIRREVIPNVLPIAIVYWGVQLPLNIVGEATLSFLGVGIVAPTPSWGNMIAEAQASAIFQSQPWVLLGPGIFLVLTVLGFNLLSSGLQNALDPARNR